VPDLEAGRREQQLDQIVRAEPSAAKLSSKVSAEKPAIGAIEVEERGDAGPPGWSISASSLVRTCSFVPVPA
jgi:hypothetical protein